MPRYDVIKNIRNNGDHDIRRKGYAWLSTIVTAMLVALLLGGWKIAAHEIPAQCAVLPQTPDEPTVRVYVHVVSPTHICTRAINGSNKHMTHWGGSFRLERWKTDHWFWIRAKEISFPLARFSLGPGQFTESVLPHSAEPPPPGLYRVCFRYADQQGEKTRRTCSDTFRLRDNPVPVNQERRPRHPHVPWDIPPPGRGEK